MKASGKDLRVHRLGYGHWSTDVAKQHCSSFIKSQQSANWLNRSVPFDTMIVRAATDYEGTNGLWWRRGAMPPGKLITLRMEF